MGNIVKAIGALALFLLVVKGLSSYMMQGPIDGTIALFDASSWPAPSFELPSLGTISYLPQSRS